MEKQAIIYDFQSEPVNWAQVPKLKIEEYPWYTGGEKQPTTVQCAISQGVIHIKTHSIDHNIRAEAKVTNEAVCEDSCFEWFVTPVNKKGESYFNIEVSCNGTIYMAYRDNTKDKKFAPKELIDQIKIHSELHETYWTLDLAIPLSVLETMQEAPIDKEVWYANFYRCGGKQDQQYACWNAITAPRPNFHLPNQFGKFIISPVSIH
ncbi:carbohydrate-binding family 9-like protein [Cellulosilyticum sp. I15G10I2]|uniref:carbohydrate-binding family 9-like protein n=1 Tax=Cellulosilyticum sp. I15G10I2 TaxID=1892843 RepID=UPI00085C9011|nr:carbohydrate-binding family 9-like protein [Cellulosilyticum sp. I15G10I2]